MGPRGFLWNRGIVKSPSRKMVLRRAVFGRVYAVFVACSGWKVAAAVAVGYALCLRSPDELDEASVRA